MVQIFGACGELLDFDAWGCKVMGDRPTDGNGRIIICRTDVSAYHRQTAAKSATSREFWPLRPSSRARCLRLPPTSSTSSSCNARMVASGFKGSRGGSKCPFSITSFWWGLHTHRIKCDCLHSSCAVRGIHDTAVIVIDVVLVLVRLKHFSNKIGRFYRTLATPSAARRARGLAPPLARGRSRWSRHPLSTLVAMLVARLPVPAQGVSQPPFEARGVVKFAQACGLTDTQGCCVSAQGRCVSARRAAVPSA